MLDSGNHAVMLGKRFAIGLLIINDVRNAVSDIHLLILHPLTCVDNIGYILIGFWSLRETVRQIILYSNSVCCVL